jgi:hypothetical protein
MKRSSRVIAVLLFSILSNDSALAKNDVEPCLPQIAAAALVANLQDIALTAGELRLLNGMEDPRLRRLLERRLAVAAAEARHHIGQNRRSVSSEPCRRGRSRTEPAGREAAGSSAA